MASEILNGGGLRLLVVNLLSPPLWKLELLLNEDDEDG